MNDDVITRPNWASVVAAMLSLLGVLTIVSGGRALFGSASAQAAVGDAVPFVLWFNFLAGFFYVVAGIGLYRWQRWAARLSLGIALTTAVVFAALVWHIASGYAFEARTVAAMVLRSGVWIVVAVTACRVLGCRGGQAETK